MPAGSMPLAGSSRISSAGSFSSAAASPSRWLHAEAVGLHEVVGPIAQPDPLEHAASTAWRPMAVEPTQQREVATAGHGREQRRRLDDRSDLADHARRAPMARTRRGPTPFRRSVARDRAGIGWSWSCPTRWARGTRTRRPPGPRGRGRRPRPASGRRSRRYSLRSPSTSITARHDSRSGVSWSRRRLRVNSRPTTGRARMLNPCSRPMISTMPADARHLVLQLHAVHDAVPVRRQVERDREEDERQEDQVVGDVGQHDEALAGARVGAEHVRGVAPCRTA